MTRLVSVAVTIVAAVAALALSAVGPSSAASTAGAERMAVSCSANLYQGVLAVLVSTSDYPPYRPSPLPPVGTFAGAQGSAVFTPDNHVAFLCNRNGSTASTVEGTGWGRSYVGMGPFLIPRGEFGPGKVERQWTGRALVTVHGNHVVIAGVGKLTNIVTWPLVRP